MAENDVVIVRSFGVEGIDGFVIEIETSSMTGVPQMSIIGLGDQAVQEAGDRIKAAVVQSGFEFPSKKIIVNLAPGDRKKRGSHYDLAMAVSLLKQSGQIYAPEIEKYGYIGELSLNGRLRPTNGVLAMAIEARTKGITELIVPFENVREASLIEGIKVYGLRSLTDVVSFLEGDISVVWDEETDGDTEQGWFGGSGGNSGTSAEGRRLDFKDVKGQEEIIRAVVVAAAGGHNLLMVGEPGCGKTMIAERLPTILPTMVESEQLDVTKIHSVAGTLPPNHSLVTMRPFRSPHHNATLNALIGGGSPAQPGEVSLAHNGVLFLDELPEFPRSTLEALRQPMENKSVTIARVSGTNTFPANFMFVAAMNPCPCGYFPSERCRCSDYEIKHYLNKVSGPILERIDIQKYVKPVNYFELAEKDSGVSSAELRERVERARAIQKERYRDEPGVNCNAQMNSYLIEKYCRLDERSQALLRETCVRNRASARVINKLLKLARTSADVDGREDISYEDVEFVLSLRDLDKNSEELFTV